MFIVFVHCSLFIVHCLLFIVLIHCLLFLFFVTTQSFVFRSIKTKSVIENLRANDKYSYKHKYSYKDKLPYFGKNSRIGSWKEEGRPGFGKNSRISSHNGSRQEGRPGNLGSRKLWGFTLLTPHVANLDGAYGRSALYGFVQPTFIRKVSPFSMTLTIWHIIDILCKLGCLLNNTASPSIM